MSLLEELMQIQSDVDWNDEYKIQVLYSPFRPKELNPESWNAKMAFWEKNLFDYCVLSKRLSFSLPLISEAFTWKGKQPHCLSFLFETLHQKEELRLKKPISFFWKFFSSIQYETEEFIFLRALNHFSQELEKQIPKCTPDVKLLSTSFINASVLQKILLTSSDFDLILSNIPHTVLKVESFLFIVVGKPEPHSVPILTLKIRSSELESQITNLMTQRDDILRKGKGNKNWLTQSHFLNKMISQKFGVLFNLQSLFQSLESAVSSKEFIENHQSVLRVLKDTSSQNSNFEKLRSQIEESLDDLHDVNSLLYKSFSSEFLVSEDEKEEEKMKNTNVDDDDEEEEEIDDNKRSESKIKSERRRMRSESQNDLIISLNRLKVYKDSLLEKSPPRELAN